MACAAQDMEDPILPPSYWELVELVGTCGSFAATACFLPNFPPVEGFEVFEESEQIREVGARVSLCRKKQV